MNYHYETQPVPNPMSYFMHQSPEIFHKFETLMNHFIELVVPFFIFLTRPFRISCGILQVLFQVILIISGNLSFLNWLTILPSLMCFDDKSLAFLFSASSSKKEVIKIQELNKAGAGPRPTWGLCVRRVFELMLGAVLAYLSIPVVQNLLSSRQAMNTSFDSFRIVNTYGAFGSVTKERTEVIFQGTRNLPSYQMNMEGFGKNISLTVNLGILRDGRVLFLRITTDWTGSCGLQHFRTISTTPG